MPPQERIDVEKLPYIDLIRRVPIKFVEWATKEIPIAYVIGDCSNNEESYDVDLDFLCKDDFYKALREKLKPQAKVQLNYESARVQKLIPKFPQLQEVQLHFQGKDLLTRGGIYDRLLDYDPRFLYLHNLKKFLKVFKDFVEKNKPRVQKILQQEQYSSPWQVFRALMTDDTLKHAFFTLVEHNLGNEVKAVLSQKWEEEMKRQLSEEEHENG